MYSKEYTDGNYVYKETVIDLGKAAAARGATVVPWHHVPVMPNNQGELYRTEGAGPSNDSASSEDGNSSETADKQLLNAIEKFKDCARIERAIKDGADVNLKDENGDFPLLKTDPFHIYEIIKELIRHNVDVNAQNKEGKTAIHFYTREYIIPPMDKVALLLLKAGADMNIKDCEGNTAWHALIDRGYKYFGKVPSQDDNNSDYDFEDYRNDHTIFLDILKYQRDINARDGNGRTALHIAVKAGEIDLVRILVEHGADVNAKDDRGSKPINEAIGNLEMTNELISARAEADFSNPSEVSGLHIRLLESDLEFLTLSIKPHTVNSRGTCNRTILHIAASLGCHQHIKNLLSLPEIDVNAKDIFGDTCLHLATQIGTTGIIEDILNAGADIAALNDSGQSMCHVAAIYGHYSLLEWLIHKGLSPNTVDNQGRNCLHYAVMYRRNEVVERLLNVNVDSKLRDCNGKMPRDYLLECENNGIIAQMLRGESPVIYILSADADPPYDQACRDVPHMAAIPTQPGIGSVKKLDNFDMSEFVVLIKSKVEELMSEAVPECSRIKILGCGSSFEGSKVVIPDEFDFVVELFKTGLQKHNAGHRFGFEGYENMPKDTGNDLITDNMSYLVWLWDKLMMWWSKHQEAAKSRPYSESVPQFQMPLPPQRHPDRTTCITWVWLYNEGAFRDFAVSIDFVPAAKDVVIGCYIVPKTPRETDDPDTRDESRKQGRASNPPFEVKYIRGLGERLLNVYITTKCLRNPDVCGFKIKKKDGGLVPVKEFTTSYMLKTAFLHLAIVFQNSDMSHGKMVLMVYELLQKGLEAEKLPTFFHNAMNVLDGSRLDLKLCILAARKMTKFVRCLYERDYLEEKRIIDTLQEQNVLLRIKVDILVEKRKLPFYFLLQPAIVRNNPDSDDDGDGDDNDDGDDDDDGDGNDDGDDDGDGDDDDNDKDDDWMDLEWD